MIAMVPFLSGIRLARTMALGLLFSLMLSGAALADSTTVPPPLTANAPAAPQGTMPNAGGPQSGVSDPNYRLGAGDHVRILVFGQPDLSGEFQVDGSGNMAMPLIGNINADGLSAKQLEKAIADKLSPDYLKEPRVSAEVITYRPFYIVGEVKNPGNYPYTNGMTVINAVAMAGGFTYRAREDSFYITRA
jgi:polysaccharide export outer membrane protein